MVTAAATVDFLHEETPLTISRRAFLEGARDTAANTSLMGRWQKLSEQPLTVCDTGHNPTASPTSPGSSKPRPTNNSTA